MIGNGRGRSGYVLVIAGALMVALSACEGYWSAKAPKDQDELAKKFTPEPNSAVIYAYRSSSLELPRALFLYSDGEFVASPKGGSFVRLVLTPGTHVLGAKSPSARSLQDTLTVVAVAGKLYYAEVGYQALGMTGDSPKLKQVEEKTAQQEIRGYELVNVGALR